MTFCGVLGEAEGTKEEGGSGAEERQARKAGASKGMRNEEGQGGDPGHRDLLGQYWLGRRELGSGAPGAS